MARLTVTRASRTHQKLSGCISQFSWDFATYHSVRMEMTKDEVAVTAAARNGCGTAAIPTLRTICDAPASTEAAIGYQRKTAEPASFIAPLRHESRVMPVMIIRVAATIGGVIFSSRKIIASITLESGVVARVGSVAATPSRLMALLGQRPGEP